MPNNNRVYIQLRKGSLTQFTTLSLQPFVPSYLCYDVRTTYANNAARETLKSCHIETKYPLCNQET